MSALPPPTLPRASEGVPAYEPPMAAPTKLVCTGCGTDNPPQARFCTQCAAALGPAKALSPSAQQDAGMVGSAAGRVSRMVGLAQVQRFSLSDLLSEAFKPRSYEEKERYLLAGTHMTTPEVMAVPTDWPKPWLFARALGLALLLFAMFQIGWYVFENPNLLPGLIITGSFVVPGAALILFYEFNVPRNVSLLLMMRLALIGGAISLLFSLVLFKLGSELSGLLGASAAGFIEESGKLAAVVFATRGLSHVRYRYTLNGLLFGAAVGVGFAAFESAGYAFRVLLEGGADNMTHNILLRGVMAPFGHVVWTAVNAAALWRIKGARPFNSVMLAEWSFMRLMLVSVACHFIWNSGLQFLFPFDVHIVVGAVIWVVVLSLVQEGLRQVKAEQQVAARLLPSDAALAGAATLDDAQAVHAKQA